MINNFFPKRPEANPTIYAYEMVGVSTHEGLLKIGYTTRDAKSRIAEQLKTARIKYKIVYDISAMRKDGTAFTDFDVHNYLRNHKIKNIEGEWFKCTIKDVQAAVDGFKNRNVE